MAASFTPHLDILPPAQRELWPMLGASSTLGYVLYGGTAIALRLGHRPSVDFDFFSESPLDKDALRATFSFIGNAPVLQDQLNTFTALVSPGFSSTASGETHDDPDPRKQHEVKISFFGGLGFGRIGKPEIAVPGDVQVASLNDLLAHKLKVILQRIEAKDYLDIATLINAGVQLDIGLAGARTMFGSNFQPSECLKALVYFEGGDLDSLPDQTRATLIEAVRDVGDLPFVPQLSAKLATNM
ncbi:MAG TPA: nucleotidyl transferase AbiEii/AbiGii toxin family protein [Ktedonobacterales bacterium]|nr:nucleotidyl transferase AbiEii/AbiGii toxin family protein [Ktedonobacterales bacterium]